MASKASYRATPYVVYELIKGKMRKRYSYRTNKGYSNRLWWYALEDTKPEVYVTLRGEWYKAEFTLRREGGEWYRGWNLIESEGVAV